MREITPAECDLAVIGLMLTDAGIPEMIGAHLLSTRERLAIALDRPDWTDEARDTMAGVLGCVRLVGGIGAYLLRAIIPGAREYWRWTNAPRARWRTW